MADVYKRQSHTTQSRRQNTTSADRSESGGWHSGAAGRLKQVPPVPGPGMCSGQCLQRVAGVLSAVSYTHLKPSLRIPSANCCLLKAKNMGNAFASACWRLRISWYWLVLMRHSFLLVRLLPEELPAIPPAGAGFGRPFLKFHIFRR